MASMSVSQFTENKSRGGDGAIEKEEKLSQECKELILSLPTEKGWLEHDLYLFQGFWYPKPTIQPLITFQKHFQAKDSDIVVASVPG